MKETARDADLLTAPLAGTPVGKLFVIGGPIALAVAIVVSLAVSYWHVRFSAIVQAPNDLRLGDPFAVRIHVLPEASTPLPELETRVWIEQLGRSEELGSLTPTEVEGVFQGNLTVPPTFTVSGAELHFEVRSPEGGGFEPMHESLVVHVSDQVISRPSEPMVAGSTLQHGDDSDPQPQQVRIALRPQGRLLSEFDNRMHVRVTRPDGKPYEGRVEVALVSGSFAEQTAQDGAQPIVAVGELNALGLLSFHGRLTSAVVRFEVRVLGDDGKPRYRRRLRMVSFAGGVVLRAKPWVLDARAPRLEVEVEALRRKPVFVDVHPRDGRWISTISPPLGVGEPPQLWEPRSLEPGIVQLEGYNSSIMPDESTSIARVQVVEGDASLPASLDPLIRAHQGHVEDARVEPGYEAAHEKAYLEAIDALPLEPAEVEAARAFLLGTLPLSRWPPPMSIVNRDRLMTQMQAKKRRWTLGMRGVLLGGGGLFLALMTWAMMRAHGRAAAATMETLQQIDDREQRAEAKAVVSAAKRAALLRGLGVVAVMAGALVLATIMLESLLWAF